MLSHSIEKRKKFSSKAFHLAQDIINGTMLKFFSLQGCPVIHLGGASGNAPAHIAGDSGSNPGPGEFSFSLN